MSKARKQPVKRGTGEKVARSPAPIRKTLRISQPLLDAAMRALGVSDETEVVTMALQRIVAGHRAASGIGAMAGRRVLQEGRIDD